MSHSLKNRSVKIAVLKQIPKGERLLKLRIKQELLNYAAFNFKFIVKLISKIEVILLKIPV